MYLHNLDNQTLQAGNRHNELVKNISNAYSQAESCRATANSLLNMAACEEDSNNAADMVSQAAEYFNRADYYESAASQMESEAECLRTDLLGYKSEYEYYMGEGETNLANLQIAANKLMNMAGTTYGGDKIKQALELTRHKIEFNTKLVDGCRKRISWIEQLCGDAGKQPVKKYTLH